MTRSSQKVPDGGSSKKKKHRNEEKTVICPVEGCDKEVLSRGLHLHIYRSSGNGHGESKDIPDHINLEDAEVVGERNVTMEYPEKRESEKVARLCPYCERPFRGKHGVMIHLGQMKGRKNHPEDGPDQFEPDDFAIVHVDENENVVEVIEEGDAEAMPSTQRRREEAGELGSLSPEKVREYIDDLREQGLDEEADRAETMLLSD
jgi:hypothetical protein